MSEPSEKLRATLSEFSDELQSLDSLDRETSDLLQSVLAEIRTLLDQQDSTGLQQASLQQASLNDRLSEAKRGFEESHPRLVRLVGEILDALGGIGI